MRQWIDSVLLDSRKKNIARIIILFVVIISLSLTIHAYLSLSKLNRNAELLSHFFSLQDSISLLNTQVNDSIADEMVKQIDEHVLKGWDSAAVVFENIRSAAVKNKIVMSYEISPLVMYPQCGESYKRLIIRISAVPGDRKYETVIKFVEAITAIENIKTSLEHLEFVGDDNGLYQVHISIASWITL
jgi:hypothetical protein